MSRRPRRTARLLAALCELRTPADAAALFEEFARELACLDVPRTGEVRLAQALRDLARETLSLDGAPFHDAAPAAVLAKLKGWLRDGGAPDLAERVAVAASRTGSGGDALAVVELLFGGAGLRALPASRLCSPVQLARAGPSVVVRTDMAFDLAHGADDVVDRARAWLRVHTRMTERVCARTGATLARSLGLRGEPLGGAEGLVLASPRDTAALAKAHAALAEQCASGGRWRSAFPLPALDLGLEAASPEAAEDVAAELRRLAAADPHVGVDAVLLHLRALRAGAGVGLGDVLRALLQPFAAPGRHAPLSAEQRAAVVVVSRLLRIPWLRAEALANPLCARWLRDLAETVLPPAEPVLPVTAALLGQQLGLPLDPDSGSDVDSDVGSDDDDDDDDDDDLPPLEAPDEPAHPDQRTPRPPPGGVHPDDFVLARWRGHELELARQFAVKHWGQVRRVEAWELVAPSPAPGPLADLLREWTCTVTVLVEQVLLQRSRKQRALAVESVILLADEARRLRDFHMVAACYAALVSPLLCQSLAKLFTPDEEYAALMAAQRAAAASGAPCVPHLGCVVAAVRAVPGPLLDVAAMRARFAAVAPFHTLPAALPPLPVLPLRDAQQSLRSFAARDDAYLLLLAHAARHLADAEAAAPPPAAAISESLEELADRLSDLGQHVVSLAAANHVGQPATPRRVRSLSDISLTLVTGGESLSAASSSPPSPSPSASSPSPSPAASPPPPGLGSTGGGGDAAPDEDEGLDASAPAMTELRALVRDADDAEARLRLVAEVLLLHGTGAAERAVRDMQRGLYRRSLRRAPRDVLGGARECVAIVVEEWLRPVQAFRAFCGGLGAPPLATGLGHALYLQAADQAFAPVAARLAQLATLAACERDKQLATVCAMVARVDGRELQRECGVPEAARVADGAGWAAAAARELALVEAASVPPSEALRLLGRCERLLLRYVDRAALSPCLAYLLLRGALARPYALLCLLQGYLHAAFLPPAAVWTVTALEQSVGRVGGLHFRFE